MLLCAVAEPVHLRCRFSYVALNCCSLLDRLEVLNVPRAVDFLVRCKNFDGSFGHVPGQHSTTCLHAQCLLPAFPPDCVHMLAGQKPACLAAAPLLLAVTMHSAPAEHLLLAAALWFEQNGVPREVKQTTSVASRLTVPYMLHAGAESHSGHCFTSVAALAIADGLEHMDTELLCWW